MPSPLSDHGPVMQCRAGHRIESVCSGLEGDIDIRGFLGLTDEVPRGFQKIRVARHVKLTPLIAQELSLFAGVQHHSESTLRNSRFCRQLHRAA